MKNLKKLVIASFMLVIAFVAVVSSTYAWFTQGQDAKVSEISIGVVDASKSILISKDNSSWVRELDLGFDGKITPVTMNATASGSDFTNPVFYQIVWDDELIPSYGDAVELVENTDSDYESFVQCEATDEFDETVIYYVEDSEAESGYSAIEIDEDTFDAAPTTYYTNNADKAGYIKFDLYFQINVANTSEWDGTKLHMDLTGLKAYDLDPTTGELKKLNNEPINNEDAVSSFRMAVLSNGKLVKIIENQVADIDSEAEGDQNDGRYGVGRQFNINNAWMQKMSNASENDVHTFVAPDAATNATKYELKAKYNEDAYSLTAPHNVATGAGNYEYFLSIEGSDTVADTALFWKSDDGLTRTYKLTIYVWMEGWDGDNVNAAASCQYRFGLSFRAE
ncbi:MAG: hypothetical protein J6X93_05710 [Bacilli bacterium]|nr:hypothetical protein [Bacilli bacterium]